MYKPRTDQWKEALLDFTEKRKIYIIHIYICTREHTKMPASFDSKQGRLSADDGDLATTKTQLETAEASKAEDESFLAKLQEMCALKAKDYEKRNVLRTNEEVAHR